MLSDCELKECALRRIQRLASSGLPLQPFVMTLFELINEAIPCGDTPQAFWADPKPARATRVGSRWLGKNFDIARWLPLVSELAIEAPSEVSGAPEMSRLLLRPGPVVTQQDLILPHFYRAQGCNECFRLLEMHHAMMTILRTHGEFLGCLPVWRGPMMGPFDRSDARFLSAAAPHIAHGLGNAYRFSSTIVADHGQFLLADSNAVGIALVDQCGRVNALNEAAKSIFYEIGVLDGLPLIPWRPAAFELRSSI